MGETCRPVDLGRAVGVSAQTVRTYETLGFLPPAQRGPQGYRRYGPRHLQALRTARAMIAGYGWQQALGIMREVHGRDVAGAVAAIDACHAELHRRRGEAQTTLAALWRVGDLSPLPGHSVGRRHRGDLRVGEAAARVGVPVSTVRFWEEQGLPRPRREGGSGYRLYDADALRALQTIVLLRGGGYGVGVVRAILADLAGGRPRQAIAAAEERPAELTEASRRACAATASFWDYTLGPAPWASPCPRSARASPRLRGVAPTGQQGWHATCIR